VASQEPREVAGLGRPETPAEKHDRVTKARAERRARQTTRNLVWSLLTSLGIVALLIIVVVRPDNTLVESVDYHSVAAEISDELPGRAVVPQLSEQWSANRAGISQEPGASVTWSLGLLGPESSYVFLDQGFSADPSWVALRTDRAPSTGDISFGYDGYPSVVWEEYDRRESDPESNNAYVVMVVWDDSTIIVGGTSQRAVSDVANEVSYQLRRDDS